MIQKKKYTMFLRAKVHREACGPEVIYLQNIFYIKYHV